MSLFRASARVQAVASPAFGLVRFYASVPAQATVARYEKNGDPEAVLKYVTADSKDPG